MPDNIGFDDVEENDVIMVGETTPLWRNCLMQVEEVRSWGVTGTVVAPQDEEYPLRVSFGEIAAVYRRVDITAGG
jgi:hypothetical protein